MLLKLGYHDAGSVADGTEYLKGYHDWSLRKPAFRGEKTGQWLGFSSVSGQAVADLQRQLREIGFFPRGAIDGVYGYRTRSAVRLFQEYVRAVESRHDIGHVDGEAGDKTQQQIKRWMSENRKPDLGGSRDQYKQAMEGLRQLQKHFKAANPKGIQLLNAHAAGTASRSVDDWTYREEDIHLIGIRRNENEVFRDGKGKTRRANDDIFVLLLNGMRLACRGSTNPSPSVAKRPDQAFLLRGQHAYRFGWHKIKGTEQAPAKTNVYRAFKPKVPAGPLIVRAIGDLLTDDSFRSAAPNPGINIHWSGSGTANWSAGCQVVAGMKYINYRNETVDLSDRAARSYGDLTGARTRGAYNALIDLITVSANDIRTNGDNLYYTLLYERDVKTTAAGAPIDFDEIVARLS
jgi:hypothetical protein